MRTTGIKHQINILNGKFIDDYSFKVYSRLPVLNVERGRNLLCEIGLLNGDREEKHTPFFWKNVDDAVCLKTDPFRRFFFGRGCVASLTYGERPPPPPRAFFFFLPISSDEIV